MKDATRPRMYRVLMIDKAIHEGQIPHELYLLGMDDSKLPDRSEWRVNCRYLARALETSEKTILRDIDYMREQMGMPIDFDKKANEYIYTDNVKELPFIQVTEKELLSLFMAQRAFRSQKASYLSQAFDSLIKKVSQFCPSEIDQYFTSIDPVLSFYPNQANDVSSDIFKSVQKAVFEIFRLSFTYKSPQKDKVSDKLIEPYHMALLKGVWKGC